VAVSADYVCNKAFISHLLQFGDTVTGQSAALIIQYVMLHKQKE